MKATTKSYLDFVSKCRACLCATYPWPSPDSFEILSVHLQSAESLGEDFSNFPLFLPGIDRYLARQVQTQGPVASLPTSNRE